MRGEEHFCTLLDDADWVQCVSVVVNGNSTIPKALVKVSDECCSCCGNFPAQHRTQYESL